MLVMLPPVAGRASDCTAGRAPPPLPPPCRPCLHLQGLAVEHPDWVPFLSESVPHITISGASAAFTGCKLVGPAAAAQRSCCVDSTLCCCCLTCHAAVAEGVPAKDTGDMIRAALATPGALAPVANLTELHGGRRQRPGRRPAAAVQLTQPPAQRCPSHVLSPAPGGT